MSTDILARHPESLAGQTHQPHGWIARILQKRLRNFGVGQITMYLPDDSIVHQRGEAEGPHAELVIHRWRALVRLLTGGDLGLAASYLDGDWDSDDLGAVLDFGAANEAALSQSLGGASALHAINWLQHAFRRNSRSGSRRNIAAHYDLGNAFYAKWLDADMHYSSGLQLLPADNLAMAQKNKLDTIEHMLNLSGGERVLEIGCGWGAVAERLVASRQCHVTGLTLSREQAAYARERLAQSGFAANTSIELRDYRDVSDKFDRIVSIEMLEAVGAQYWPVYFEKLATSLKPGGCAVLQVITINEKYFDSYRRRPDYIQKYIFPGGMLPTKTIMHEQALQAGLKISQERFFGSSYAHTLCIWRENFMRNWSGIEPLGFDTRFRRMWDYYLRYCETGFNYGLIDVGLYKLEKA